MAQTEIQDLKTTTQLYYHFIISFNNVFVCFFQQIVVGNTPLVMYSNSNQNKIIQIEKRFTLQSLQLNHTNDTGIAYVLCGHSLQTLQANHS